MQDVHHNLEHLRPAQGQEEAYKRLIANIDYKAIENAYANALAKSMSNQEVNLLIKAAETPGMMEAFKKQTIASSGVVKTIFAEVQKAGKKAGIPMH